MLGLLDLVTMGSIILTDNTLDWKENDRAIEDITLKNEKAQTGARSTKKLIYEQIGELWVPKVKGLIIDIKIKFFDSTIKKSNPDGFKRSKYN